MGIWGGGSYDMPVHSCVVRLLSIRGVAGGEAVLYDRWCGTPVHQGGNPPTLLQTLLEPQNGTGQEEL